MIHNSLQQLQKMLPLVSIVCPVYNSEQFISSTIQSLQKQTYKNIEVLFVDDGSTDRSREIISQYVQGDSRLILIQVENQGPGHARNTGLLKASGKYVLFMDADDQLENITVDLAVASAEKHNSDFVVFDWLYVNEKTGKENYCNKDTVFSKEILIGEDIHQLLDMTAIYTVNKLYNRKYLLENDIRYAERYLYEDNIFWVQAVVHAKKISLIHSPLYRITTHSDSATQVNHNTDRHYKEFVTTTKECVDFLTNKDHPVCGTVIYKILLYLVTRFILTYTKRTPKEYRSTLLREFVDLVSLLPAEDHKKSRMLSVMIRQNILRKKKYGKFKFWINYSYKYRPLFDKILKRTKQTAKHFMKIPHYISVICKKVWKKFKSLLKEETVYQQNLKKNIYQDVILFMGFDHRYTGNSRYLFEQMCQCDLGGKKLFFVTEDPAVPENYRITPNTERSDRLIARAQTIIFESWVPLKYVKRSGTTWIQLWHGTPLKRMLFDSHERAITESRPVHKLDKFKDLKRWDYLVVDTPTAVSFFKTAFLFPEEKQLTCGYPRVKYLLDNRHNTEYIHALREKYDISFEKKIVLYLPTWRDYNYGRKDSFDLDYLINLSRLQNLLGNEYEIIYKDHAYLSRPENVDFKNYSTAETQELLLIADYLITDYSSVLFDALAIDLPVIMYCNDFERNEQDRGVYEEMWQDFLPFVCNEVDQVAQRIQSYPHNDNYAHAKEKYSYKQVGCELISFILSK